MISAKRCRPQEPMQSPQGSQRDLLDRLSLDNMLKRRRTRLTPALRRCRGGRDKVTSVHPTPRKPWPLGRENGGIPGHSCRLVVSAVLVNKVMTSGPVATFFRIRHLKGSN